MWRDERDFRKVRFCHNWSAEFNFFQFRTIA
jgi:hypothetical protein